MTLGLSPSLLLALSFIRRFCFGETSASRRAAALAIPFALGGLVIGCGVVWSQAPGAGASTGRTAAAANADRTDGDGTAGAVVSAAAGTPMRFPLVVRPGKRYLEDVTGKPFLIHGDTAWSLIAELTREDVDRYLDDRHARGFNTILVSLIEYHYSTNAPANAYGQQPFLRPGDYTAPNEAYFAHADWVLRRAAATGFLVLLTPSYTGCCGDAGTKRWSRTGRFDCASTANTSAAGIGTSPTSCGSMPGTPILRGRTW